MDCACTPISPSFSDALCPNPGSWNSTKLSYLAAGRSINNICPLLSGIWALMP